MHYTKGLDGVRAVAVAMVMLFHFGYFAPGWIGVQVFFTLSGFLITRILLDARRSPARTFMLEFYWHRAVRIYPLIYFFILLCGLSYALFGAPASYASDWPWLVSFTGNFARLRPGDIGPGFVHIWSLAIEQQFYLVWPLLLYFLPAKAFRTVVVGLLALTPLIRLCVFQWLVHLGHTDVYAGTATYVLPFTQFDAFAAGAAIPLWRLDEMRYPGRYFLICLGLTGAAGIGVLAVCYFQPAGAFIASLGYSHLMIPEYEYVWGYSLLNLLSMLAIVCTLRRAGPVVMLLETTPLVWMGKISYGVYVYHVPLLILGEYLMARAGIINRGKAHVMLFLGWSTMVLLASYASFRWIESPFLRYKNLLKTRLPEPRPCHS